MLSCSFEDFFHVNWGHEGTVQPETLWLLVLSLPCGMDCALHLLMGGAPFPYLFSPENAPLGSLSCQHAVGWPVHTWILPLVPLPWCSSRTIILLWQWQSRSLWSVPGIQNRQAMPALKGGRAAAAKSECRDDSEESKLFGTQNLQL